MSSGADPNFFFKPETVAVIGATEASGKISGIIMDSLASSGFQGRIYPVNPKYSSVKGYECYPSIGAIGEAVDVAIVALPAFAVAQALEEAASRVRGAIVIGGGFSEAGEAGQALERELKSLAVKTGMRIIGPNCMGIYDTVSRLDTFFIPPERIKRPGTGHLSVVSQSGSFAVTAMDELASESTGIARVISYGNSSDVNESDLLEFLADDEHTSAVAMYLEAVVDGQRFIKAAARCAAKKPVMAVKAGRGGAGQRATFSHTASIAGRYEIYKAAFKKAGIIELDGYEEFIAACKVFGAAKARPSGGARVMIITDGGGVGVALADECARRGLEAVPLKKEVEDGLSSMLPPYFAVGNPLDLTGSATDEWFASSLEKTMAGDDYDVAIVAALWGPPGLTDGLARGIAVKADESGKPVIICSPGGEYSRDKSRLFTGAGLPVFSTPESAVRAASILAKDAAFRKGRERKPTRRQARNE
ncbi:MAG: acetate--CoA ligase family protein [Deltaproteobacteria bacterium]|nr:acetate--CoA ligase family protein [Deltaproteobacteria bacterium]